MFTVGSLNNLLKYENGVFSRTGIKAYMADKNYYVDLNYDLFRDDHVHVSIGPLGRRLSKLFVLDKYVLVTDGFGCFCVLDKDDKIIIHASGESLFSDDIVPVDFQISNIRESTTMPGKEVVTAFHDGKAYMQRINKYNSSGRFFTEEINAAWFRKTPSKAMIITYKRNKFTEFFETYKKSEQFSLYIQNTGFIRDTIYFHDKSSDDEHEIRLVDAIKKLEENKYIVDVGSKTYFIDNGKLQSI